MRVNGPGTSSTNATSAKSAEELVKTAAPVKAHGQEEAEVLESSSGDQVEISDEARMAAQVHEASQATETTHVEEVRQDKVEAAKKFLAAGLYNDKGVLEQTASKMQSFI